MLDMQTFLKRLADGPLGREMLKAETDKRLAEQRRLVAERVAAEEALTRALPAHRKSSEQAIARFDKAKAALGEAEAHLRATYRSEQEVRNAKDRLEARCNARLRELADPRIEAEAGLLLEEQERARQTMRPSYQGGGEPLLRGGTSPATHSTLPSIHAHLAGIRAAREAVLALTFEAIPADELEARIAAIRAAIPDPDVLVEVA